MSQEEEYFEENEGTMEGDDNDEENVISIESNNDSLFFSSPSDDKNDKIFSSIFSSFENCVKGVKVENNIKEYKYVINIPRTFLPLIHQILYGFDIDETALVIKIYYIKNSQKLIDRITVEQPSVGNEFTGRGLIQTAVSNFLSSEYKPRTYYRSSPFVLIGPTEPTQQNIISLTNKYFDRIQSIKALSHCHNDVDKSINLLRTGIFTFSEDRPNINSIINYHENPLVFLLLEILECIFDLRDHCSMCRCPIPPAIKPTACGKPICEFQLADVGVGTSLIQEIKRDTKVADLLLTFFSSAIGTMFLTPAPINSKTKHLLNFVNSQKSFEKVAEISTNKELREKIGNDNFDLLRWVLLTNRSQLFHLPKPLQLPQLLGKNGSPCLQFMALMSTPEQEEIFQQLKAKFGSVYLWHGSCLDRWHSIVRNGLMNASGKEGFMVNGMVFGEGIYFGYNSETSMSYAVPMDNVWKNSRLGRKLSVLALCEVINFPRGNEKIEVDVDVKNNGTGKVERRKLSGYMRYFDSCVTLTIEEACIVRFLLVNLENDVDFYHNPPSKVPTINDMMEYLLAPHK